jgi:hypothetical protein
MPVTEQNIFGEQLIACCFEPLTGYLRDGYCKNTAQDTGTHILCACMTEDFLNYTKSRGNDLSTPIPHWGFPGLKPGDFWCLCISRWLQAEKAGKAPPLKLEACHISALKYTSLEVLQKFEYKGS